MPVPVSSVMEPPAWCRWVLWVLLCLSPLAQAQSQCTAFALPGPEGPLVGKNFDWSHGSGLLMVNPRGLLKTAAVDSDYFGEPARWRADFASISLNQFGREFPEGGINEAGLVVQGLGLPETRYPPADERPALTSAQWIQYQLDRFARVDQVIAGLEQTRISPSPHYPGSQYLMCERSGACAVLAFLDGQAVIHRDRCLPVPVLTNIPYRRALSAWILGLRPEPDPKAAALRFALAANQVTGFHPQPGADPVDYAFRVLRSVQDLGGKTQWSLVYDSARAGVRLRTAGNPRIRHLELGGLALGCEMPARLVEVNADLAGDLRGALHNYSLEINRDIIREALGHALAGQVTGEALDAAAGDIARYPEHMLCTPTADQRP